LRQTSTEILIRGTVEQVVALAFDLPRWPEFLPHYRWVTVLERDGHRQTVEMACWRVLPLGLRLPLKWRSHLWVRRAEGRMRFLHVAGPARGMDVGWLVRQEGELVRVTIRHDLSLEVPLVRTGLGRWIVGEFFVGAVAGRTLACLRAAVEERNSPQRHGDTEKA
jgi:ribosome-associated toxin RatA of RatAB toxin-antitoxin module